jgi:hypothetical protein
MFKHILKFTLLLGVISQLFVACQNKDAVEPTIELPQVCNLTKIAWDVDETVLFIYDSKNRLIGTEYLTPTWTSLKRNTAVVEFDNNDRAVKVIKSYYYASATSRDTIIIEYDNLGKPTSYFHTYDKTAKYILSFDANDKLTKITYPQDYELEYTALEYNSKGNCIAGYIKNKDKELVKHVSFTEYDNSKNPFYGLGIESYLLGHSPYSANNIKTFSGYDDEGNITGTVNYKYTYDNKGNILTSTYSSTTHDNPSEEKNVAVATYSYQCK